MTGMTVLHPEDGVATPFAREGQGLTVRCECGRELRIDLDGWRILLPGGIIFGCPDCGHETALIPKDV